MPRATSPTGAPRQVHLEVAGPDRDRRTYDPLGAFETILEHSPLRVIIFDRDLVVREVSRPAAELAQMAREELRGQTLRTDFVRAVGCDAAQGYYLARPMPHGDCTEYLLRAAEGPVL
jgi:PAS domain-containing protein